MSNCAEKNAISPDAVLPAAIPTNPARGPADVEPRPREIGGPSGPEPTRFGDWERKGRCIDF
jgi:hypothetical protein